MSGYGTVLKVRDFEASAVELGFEICNPGARSYHSNTIVYNNDWIGSEVSNMDLVTLVPADNRYPCYKRGAQVFTGTIEEAKNFFQGIRFAYNSDKAIGLSNEQKRASVEAKELVRIRKREELRIKKEEQKKIWHILSDGSVEDEEVPF